MENRGSSCFFCDIKIATAALVTLWSYSPYHLVTWSCMICGLPPWLGSYCLWARHSHPCQSPQRVGIDISISIAAYPKWRFRKGIPPLFQGKSRWNIGIWPHRSWRIQIYIYIFNLVVEWLRFMVAMHPRSGLQWVFHSPENSSKHKIPFRCKCR